MFSWRCFPFVESTPRAYRLKASNAAPPISTSAGTIPSEERKQMTWNNLGVVLDHFGLLGMAVQAYRKSEDMGETLAMSNLAQKFIFAGFVREAQEQCDKALATK